VAVQCGTVCTECQGGQWEVCHLVMILSCSYDTDTNFLSFTLPFAPPPLSLLSGTVVLSNSYGCLRLFPLLYLTHY
jgi:hypothetical protein